MIFSKNVIFKVYSNDLQSTFFAYPLALKNKQTIQFHFMFCFVMKPKKMEFSTKTINSISFSVFEAKNEDRLSLHSIRRIQSISAAVVHSTSDDEYVYSSICNTISDNK